MGSCGSREENSSSGSSKKPRHSGGAPHTDILKADEFGGKSNESMLSHNPPTMLRVDTIVRPDSFRAKHG